MKDISLIDLILKADADSVTYEFSNSSIVRVLFRIKGIELKAQFNAEGIEVYGVQISNSEDLKKL